MYSVYMLECSDGTLYTGISNRLDARIKKHNRGAASHYTASRLPVRLVYSEPQPDKSSALRREIAIRKLTRAAKRKLLENNPRE
ncbi:MAG: GIY-YIG nuclease family protein [Acidaminococcales bacterium]|jgi:predicted GIY-YIG superfamily endonuclease|nr:GIY-YIG nuclease family protein [Acidaminococcales bacterium]